MMIISKSKNWFQKQITLKIPKRNLLVSHKEFTEYVLSNCFLKIFIIKK